MKCSRYVGTGLAEKKISLSRRRQSSPAYAKCHQPIPHVEMENLILHEKQSPKVINIQKSHCIRVSTKNLNEIDFQVSKSNSLPCLKLNQDRDSENFESGKDEMDAMNSKEKKVIDKYTNY